MANAGKENWSFSRTGVDIFGCWKDGRKFDYCSRAIVVKTIGRGSNLESRAKGLRTAE